MCQLCRRTLVPYSLYQLPRFRKLSNWCIDVIISTVPMQGRLDAVLDCASVRCCPWRVSLSILQCQVYAATWRATLTLSIRLFALLVPRARNDFLSGRAVWQTVRSSMHAESRSRLLSIPLPTGQRIIVMTVSYCLSVCPSVIISPELHA